MSRHVRGEGSIYQRKDGRWVGSTFVETVAGKRKRIHIYAKTRSEVSRALSERMRDARRGIRTPDQAWTIGTYLDYWIEEVATKNRPRTIEEYKRLVRNHLSEIGHLGLVALTPSKLQQYLNHRLATGVGVRTVEASRSVLRAALSHAERQELVPRNVAKLVEIPSSKPAPVQPWTAEEVERFLEAATGHRWYAAYVLVLHLGLRRGEVLGLSWGDLDLAVGTIQLRQQLQRFDGKLQLAPLKTDASRRLLALEGLPARAMEGIRRDPASQCDLIFTTTRGTPVDPRNFWRAFHEIRRAAGLRYLTLHKGRHTAATLLKDAGVPDRDAQLILGHAHVTTTQQIYQHGSDGMRGALVQFESALASGRVAVNSAVSSLFSTGQGTEIGALTSGGPSGDRTRDTLLKSLLRALPVDAVTPVMQHVRSRAHAHLLGGVAVRDCCQLEPFASTNLNAEWLDIAQMPVRLAFMQVAERNFPNCLLPPR